SGGSRLADAPACDRRQRAVPAARCGRVDASGSDRGDRRGRPRAVLQHAGRASCRARLRLAPMLRRASHAAASVEPTRRAVRPRDGRFVRPNRMTTSSTRVLIIGAGPTGLGAAWRLLAAGESDWLLCEAAVDAGGLASSVVDDAGFTWDLGGHVQ